MHFSIQIDAGRPTFTLVDDIFQITCREGDKGRFIGHYDGRLKAYERLILRAHLRTNIVQGVAVVALVWWKSGPGNVRHSTIKPIQFNDTRQTFTIFTHEFTVPQDVKRLTVELRGRAGPGTYEYTAVCVFPAPEWGWRPSWHYAPQQP